MTAIASERLLPFTLSVQQLKYFDHNHDGEVKMKINTKNEMLILVLWLKIIRINGNDSRPFNDFFVAVFIDG